MKTLCRALAAVCGLSLGPARGAQLQIETSDSPMGKWSPLARFDVGKKPMAFFRVALLAGSLTNFGAFGAVTYLEAGSSITEAANNATPGTTVVVGPGTYVGNNLLRPGVNWYFQQGAVVTYTERNTGPGWGIFDDRPWGAITNTIGGFGVFEYSCGVPGFTNTGTYSLDPTNFNVTGLMVITNARSRVTVSAERMQARYAGSFATFSVIYALDGVVRVDCKEILDPDAGSTVDGGYDEEGTPQGQIGTTANAITWQNGEMYVNAQTIRAGNHYAIWCEQTAGTRTTNNFYCDSQLIQNYGGLSTIYVVGLSNEYRTWIQGKLIERLGGAAGYSTYAAYTAGRHYLNAQKLSNFGGDSCVTLSGVNSNVTAWVTAQKLTAATNSNWLKIANSGGILWADIQQFEDAGAMARGIWLQGGELHLKGGHAKILAGDGLVITNATAWIDGLWLDTSTANQATNRPIQLFGSATLRLKNVDLLAPASAWGIYATQAHAVKILGTTRVNKASAAAGGSTNLTAQIGTVTYDTNLQ